jgi:hypothetical protein
MQIMPLIAHSRVLYNKAGTKLLFLPERKTVLCYSSGVATIEKGHTFYVLIYLILRFPARLLALT